ncbi:hypothetical protein H310_15226 [Aphanomyces invadans]|uniref:Uncharacterized protein n=1 Tax=Aphanomyces invadans TaxID=157072 RepID=A0A024T7S9_9STRA|nr:hypothetical protein H310_15226 [Aphanomyces invadans]ETV89933.1 hypothetical protein H310_15226 [Aphanomyces invadans]|eukprot:XP_008881436.1 hypothetical protein H310_15226 [Aphanomyces invadans]
MRPPTHPNLSTPTTHANGRLKAVHERELDGKSLVTTWNRATKDDEGTHETICSEGVASAEEFEGLWKDTPFAKAQKAGEPLPASDNTKTLPKEDNPAIEPATQQDATMS